MLWQCVSFGMAIRARLSAWRAHMIAVFWYMLSICCPGFKVNCDHYIAHHARDDLEFCINKAFEILWRIVMCHITIPNETVIRFPCGCGLDCLPVDVAGRGGGHIKCQMNFPCLSLIAGQHPELYLSTVRLEGLPLDASYFRKQRWHRNMHAVTIAIVMSIRIWI